MTAREEQLQGDLRALQHREKYVTGLIAKVKVALGDAEMPDDEVEAAVAALVQTVARTREIAGYLKVLTLDAWPILTMRKPDVQRELKTKYPEWETEV